ncbi:DUF1232 domain-containing protein [Candidatus Peregrinibacteria bacterium]|nr:DUF1232 domain-containing protein [Candidatus Peregrinibacteria bacterium]
MRSLKSYYFFWRALYRDKRTPWSAKLLMLWIPLLYGISPVDLIPEVLPVIGVADDLVLIPLLIWIAMQLIAKPVKEEHRHKFLRSAK